jgi:uncharacterized protein YukE
MSEHIKVNTDRLQGDADFINARITKIEKLVDQLNDHKIALDAMWDGPSSEAFKSTFDKDISELKEVIKLLKKLNDYEGFAKGEYDTCERKVSDLIDQIKVR